MIRNVEVGVCILRGAKRNFLPETAKPIRKRLNVEKGGFTKVQRTSFADFAESMRPELEEYIKILKGGKDNG